MCVDNSFAYGMECDLACLVAIGIGGNRTLATLNHAGCLSSEDLFRDHVRLDPPLLPDRPPTVDLIVSRDQEAKAIVEAEDKNDSGSSNSSGGSDSSTGNIMSTSSSCSTDSSNSSSSNKKQVQKKVGTKKGKKRVATSERGTSSNSSSSCKKLAKKKLAANNDKKRAASQGGKAKEQ